LLPVLNELVRSLTPLIQEYLPALVSWISQLIDWFKNLDPEMQKIILAFTALAPVITIVTGLITAIIPVIMALLSPIGLVIIAITALATIWFTNWNDIQGKTKTAIDFILGLLETAKNYIKGWADKIYSNLVEPFERAWNKIKEIVENIKNKLDFTKRHSPSVVDIINKGVDQVNKALNGIEFNNSITPQVATSGMASSNQSTRVNNIVIDMQGAYIGSEFVANEIGEKIGDSIIKKLQMNVRI
jgi:phage-related protein